MQTISINILGPLAPGASWASALERGATGAPHSWILGLGPGRGPVGSPGPPGPLPLKKHNFCQKFHYYNFDIY